MASMEFGAPEWTRPRGSGWSGIGRGIGTWSTAEMPSHAVSPESRRVLVATADPMLLDEILRLSAASSLEVEVAEQVGHIRASWASAPLVLVGADLAGALARVAPPRRPQVLLIGRAPVEPAIWQAAVALGVDHVVELPEGERWLVDRLGDLGDGPHRHGLVVGVLGGRGGAGASTLAAGLAITAADRGLTSLLVDADPWAGGIDVLLGAESDPGLRWPDLASARGRIRVPGLEQALPRRHGVAMVSWDRRPSVYSGEALTAVVEAGRRGFDLVVVDLARALIGQERSMDLDRIDGDVAGRTGPPPTLDTVIVVVPTEVRAVTGAAQLLPLLRSSCADVRLALRHLPNSMVDRALVTEALGCPVTVEIADDPVVTASVDTGDPTLVGDRSTIGRAALIVLESLGLPIARPVSGAA